MYTLCSNSTFPVSSFTGFVFSFTGDVVDPATTTPNHCQCTSMCGPSMSDGYSTDWCYTADRCGEYTLGLGYWDYCLYLQNSKPDHVALTWKDKQSQLLELIKADDTMGKWNSALRTLFVDVKEAFNNEWDILAEGRPSARTPP